MKSKITGVILGAFLLAACAAEPMEVTRVVEVEKPVGGNIGFQQWGLARQQVNTAIDIIHPAIQSLGGE